MKNFSDYLKKEEFVEAYLNVYSGEYVEAGLLYVEDSSDRGFWECVVDAVCPGLYRVMKYSQNGSDGKRLLEKEYDNLHKKFIIGVDGDYDYLCPDRNQFALKLNQNPFILHTHSYAVENLRGCKEAIAHYSNKFRLHEETRNFLIQALEAYSAVIYEALCLFAYLHNKSPQVFVESEINGVLFSNTQALPISNDLTVNQAFIAEILAKANEYVARHMASVTDAEEFAQYKATLAQKGMNDNTAYLFVEAHAFFDSILIPSIDKIRYKCKQKDIQHVRDNYQADVVSNKINNVVNHYDDNLHIKSVVYQCESYTQSFTWQKITQKLISIVS